MAGNFEWSLQEEVPKVSLYGPSQYIASRGRVLDMLAMNLNNTYYTEMSMWNDPAHAQDKRLDGFFADVRVILDTW